jgi:hypothetical protein
MRTETIYIGSKEELLEEILKDLYVPLPSMSGVPGSNLFTEEGIKKQLSDLENKELKFGKVFYMKIRNRSNDELNVEMTGKFVIIQYLEKEKYSFDSNPMK